MIFNTAKFVLFVTAVALPAAAVDICFFSNTQGCSGSAVCCVNKPVNFCCGPSTTATGFSVQWTNLAESTSAQAWTNSGCAPASSAIRTFLNGPGTKCWTGGGVRAVSSSWNWGTGGRIVGNATASPCSAPDVFKYSDTAGVEHTVPLTADRSIDDLQVLYDAGDFTSLAALDGN